MRPELEGNTRFGQVEQKGMSSILDMLVAAEGEMLVMETGTVWNLEEASGSLSLPLT